jgi:hypothetical protein
MEIFPERVDMTLQIGRMRLENSATLHVVRRAIGAARNPMQRSLDKAGEVKRVVADQVNSQART